MKRILALIVVLSLLVPMVSVAESNDFSNSIALESGVVVSGYVTESNGDNPDDKYQIGVSKGDTIDLKITSDEYIDFCLYIGENGGEELDCYYEMHGEREINLLRRENTDNYYVKIDCGSSAYECSSSAEYTLKITIYPDEAGDTLEDAEELLPEVRISGWAPLDEDAEPIDFDYYRTPVVEGDTVRIVITSTDMTSYRIYDQYGIKIGEGYEEGNYDLSVNFDYSGNLYIELFCVQNYMEPCEYSLIAIGSTYVDSPTQDSEGTEEASSEGNLTGTLYAIILVVGALFLISAIISRNRSNVTTSVQPIVQNTAVNDEMMILQQTVTEAELEKMKMKNELDKAKSTTVVQNITYNIQDTAISGDINATGLKEKED